MSGSTEQFYSGEAGRRYQDRKRAVPEPAIPWVARSRAEKFQYFVRPPDTVVEIGVGLGWNLAHLKCARRIGTDLEDFMPSDLKRAGIEFQKSPTALPAEIA